MICVREGVFESMMDLGRRLAVLTSTGEMCPCDFTPLSIGRYPDESLAELWNRMMNSALYARRSKVCRMQDPDFRRRTVERIPAGAGLPYPIERLCP